jgi:hypothetical protein
MDIDAGMFRSPTLSPPARIFEPAQTSHVCCLRSHTSVCLQVIMHELIERDRPDLGGARWRQHQSAAYLQWPAESTV